MPEGTYPYLPELQLMVGGASVAPSLASAIRRRLTPNIMMVLGSTEVSHWARVVVKSTDDDLVWYRVEPDATVEVVDDADKCLPTGTLGNLRILEFRLLRPLAMPVTQPAQRHSFTQWLVLSR